MPKLYTKKHWLDQEAFTHAISALPLISIDLYITRSSQYGVELLLGQRNNRPAQGWWFTPGGRIRKSEPLKQALYRIGFDEVGLNSSIMGSAKLLGLWDHFYPDSAFVLNMSTHYVNIAYVISLNTEQADQLSPVAGPGEQHQVWQWFTFKVALNHVQVHDFVKVSLQTLIADINESF